MKNDRVIIVNGIGRGGTNIVWNLLQSHLDVCSPVYETGEVLRAGPGVVAAMARRDALVRLARRWPLRPAVGWLVDAKLFRYKRETLKHPDNRYKAEGVEYTRAEVERSVLCTKSVMGDRALSELLAEIYPQATVIGVVRDGFALAEGHLRRGAYTASEIGREYRDYLDWTIRSTESSDRHMIVRFEDVLADPFGMASEMFRFAGLEPTTLDKLRLKSKAVVTPDGRHEARYGEQGRKYWFDREAIREILVPDQSETQRRRLSPEDAEAFEREAASVLRHFGYL